MSGDLGNDFPVLKANKDRQPKCWSQAILEQRQLEGYGRFTAPIPTKALKVQIYGPYIDRVVEKQSGGFYYFT